MNLVDKYRAILDAANCTGPALPVIFNGGEGPRLIGYAQSSSDVDCALMCHRLSATYISKAEIDGDERKFFVAHG